uniref:Transmembrane 4 L6 family member 1 n=1 Tax=Fundulus heteroclitus TaxID=8078 RepID=A0A146WM24_FUNHE
MCTGKCSLFIAITLYPLVLLSIICNILLFFPGWSTKYVKEGHITDEVKYMGGFVGGGVLVLIPALYIHLTGEQGCCANRFGMFFSIVFAAVGAAGAVYSFVVALIGFSNGPLCKTPSGSWDTPFKETNMAFVKKPETWSTTCIEPTDVVKFNLGLFVTLMVASVLQALLCASQIINGLVGCICGTCDNKEVKKPCNVENVAASLPRSAVFSSVRLFSFAGKLSLWAGGVQEAVVMQHLSDGRLEKQAILVSSG